MTADPAAFDWPVRAPHLVRRRAGADDIDGFGHVNNVRYIDWVLDAAWAHSNALGMTMDDYRRIGVGCVVHRHEFSYVAPVLEGEEVVIATWIDETDGRLRMTRAYDMRRAGDGGAVFRGRTHFVTIDMATGKPARMPKEFAEVYAPAAKREED